MENVAFWWEKSEILEKKFVADQPSGILAGNNSSSIEADLCASVRRRREQSTIRLLVCAITF